MIDSHKLTIESIESWIKHEIKASTMIGGAVALTAGNYAYRKYKECKEKFCDKIKDAVEKSKCKQHCLVKFGRYKGNGKK
jgi:formylmethanofuran:tetrahydromethanopterin formyltransferase